MNYGDWHEAAVGGSGIGGGGANDGGDGNDDADVYLQQAMQRQERDAVLCLVDCQSSMFNQILNASLGTGDNAEGNPASGQEVKREAFSSSLASRNEEPTPGETSFTRAMKCVLHFYQDKVVTSDKDVVALVLYNTRERKNVFDYNGVYVLHSFGLLGASSVQEVELLQFAGSVASSYYAEFSKSVGHGTPLSTSAQVPPGSLVCRLSDVLWTGQQMFLSLKSTAVKYRRIFVFTDDDDPCRGDSNESDRCITRVKDLREVGVEFEVFAFGSSGKCDTLYAPHSSSSLRPTLTSVASPGTVGSDTSATPSVIGSTTSGAAAKRAFNRDLFWQRIVSLSVPKKEGTFSLDGFSDRRSDVDALDQHLYHGGGVYVDNDDNLFADLLDTVRRKTHPQRPTQSLKLYIGFRSDRSASEQEVPTMVVNVFNPLMPTSGLKSEWVDGASNVLAKREARYVVRPQQAGKAQENDEAADNNLDEVAPAAASKAHKTARDNASPHAPARKIQAMDVASSINEADTHVKGRPLPSTETDDACFPVQPSEIRLSTAVGGTRVYFTASERAAVTAAAAAGAPQGFNIICFKRQEDVLKYKHILKRSSFLHPNLRTGGAASLKLFVQLYRVLMKQQKVAVAQAVMRSSSAPTLVALVPAPCGGDGSDIEAWRGGSGDVLQNPLHDSLPTEGMGFYVVPLPYAEDIRSVPFRTGDTLAQASAAVGGQSNAPVVKTEFVEKAKAIIDALSVDYDIIAVPNPSLQKMYTMIQHLALRYDHATDAPTAMDRGAETAVFSTRLSKLEENRSIEQFEDLTLPDYAGMTRYSDLFKEFADEVLTPEYNAEKQCSARPPAASRARKADAAARPPQTSGKKAPRSAVKKETVDGSQNESSATPAAAVDEGLVNLVNERIIANEVSRLTIPQMKTYLAIMNVPTRGLKVKDDYIAAVKNTNSQE